MMTYTTNAGVQEICPTGWHIPTDAEWTTVTTFLGGTGVAGGKMKSTGTIEAGTGLWYSPNSGTTNESGFTADPGGIRYDDGAFYSVGTFGYWWSSTEDSTNNAWLRNMSCCYSDVGSLFYYKSYGFSVRCLRNF